MTTQLLLVQVLNGLQLGILLFLVAAGLTLVFGVMDFINLAHGVQYMLGAYLGATFAALHGHDAVVQLAANGEPDWDHLSGAARFHVNTLIAYNVFQASVHLGIKRVVWASSETVLGFPFTIPPMIRGER